MLSFLYVYSDHSILECYNLFSGVELSMRSFFVIYGNSFLNPSELFSLYMPFVDHFLCWTCLFYQSKLLFAPYMLLVGLIFLLCLPCTGIEALFCPICAFSRPGSLFKLPFICIQALCCPLCRYLATFSMSFT